LEEILADLTTVSLGDDLRVKPPQVFKIIDHKIIHETLQNNKTQRDRERGNTIAIEMEDQRAEN